MQTTLHALQSLNKLHQQHILGNIFIVVLSVNHSLFYSYIRKSLKKLTFIKSMFSLTTIRSFFSCWYSSGISTSPFPEGGGGGAFLLGLRLNVEILLLRALFDF